MKNSYEISFRVSEETLRKFLYVSEKENRNPSAQFSFMVRNNIAYFEKTKGRIADSELRSIDISEYEAD